MAKTFVKITNEDIYHEVKKIGEDYEKLTNKINRALWVSASALSISCFAIITMVGYFIK